MKKYLFFLLASFLFFSNHLTAQTKPYPEIPRISSNLAYSKFKSGNVLLVDTMNKTVYASYHILGAISLPCDGPEDWDHIRNGNLSIPLDKEIIVYCD